MTAPTARDLEILACDIACRPLEAPALGALRPYITAARREPAGLTLDIAPAGVDLARAVVAAEQTCCASLGWDLDSAGGGGSSRLRISASPAQIDVLARLLLAPNPTTTP